MFWRAQETQQRQATGKPLDGGDRVMTLRALEPRVLLDAAVAATAAGAVQEPPHQEAPPPPPDPTTELVQALADVAPAPSAVETPAGTAVYFIDAAVPDSQALVDAIGPGAEVHMIEAGRDGMEQIAQALQGRSDIGSVHIISHGSEGALRLGSATLDAASLQGQYQDELQTIGRALTVDLPGQPELQWQRHADRAVCRQRRRPAERHRHHRHHRRVDQRRTSQHPARPAHRPGRRPPRPARRQRQ